MLTRFRIICSTLPHTNPKRPENSMYRALLQKEKGSIATQFTLLLLLILSIIMSGCVTATISPPQTLVRDTIPIVLASDYPTVTVHDVSGKHRAGTLYALLVLPVGSIVFLDPKIGLEDSVTRAIVKAPPLGVHSIEISLKSVEMTAYDLIFTRKIRCSIEGAVKVKTTSAKSPSRTIMISESVTRYRTLAFSPQIAQVGRECFEAFGTTVVSSVARRILGASEESLDDGIID
jgi:hypothetical protein